MRKLLSANFVRLFRDRFFQAGIVFMAVAGGYVRIMLRPGEEGEYAPCLDDAFLLYAMLMGILLAAFCSLFIGKDYSDGTIRNKVMAGHTRMTIYLSNLLTCLAAGLLFCLAYILPTCAVGIPLMGWLRYPQTTVMVLCSLVTATVFSSVFTLISMLKQSRSMAVVICTLGVFIGLFLSSYIYSRLQEPEFYSTYWMEMGEETSGVDEEVPNPYYISGVKRDWYQFLTDFLPTSQSILLAFAEPVHVAALFVYDGITIFVTTLAGLYFFRRKDLK